ncbi:MAG: ribonuclease R [Alkalispirochaetaceae bacterium]
MNKRKPSRVTGMLTMSAKGFGFVRNNDGPDIFVDYENRGTAMDGDTVTVEVFSRSSSAKPAGRIIAIVERSGRNIVGLFHTDGEGGKVYPEDQKLPASFRIAKGEVGKVRGLADGLVVVVQLKEWRNPKEKPLGKVVEVLGRPDEPGMDLKLVARSKGLPLSFPTEVEKSAEKLSFPRLSRELNRRRDLREWPCFTIDPKDAKDFDDAVAIRQLESGLFEVAVHIADVGAFVGEGDTIDREAFNRGTSVYFVQSVIPMLPERLSNDLCSLRPKEDRLAYSVIMQLDSRGEVHNSEIVETVIRSHQRFSYEEAEGILKGSPHKYASQIHLLQLVASTLRQRRSEAGSIDFDMSEQHITLDREGIPRQIKPKERLNAHRLIEEFMLLANRIVAETVIGLEMKWKKELPFVYRIHQRPEREEIDSFLQAVSNLGIKYKVGERVGPEDYRNILKTFENLEQREFVEQIALSSMTKAVYATVNKGHFGLAFEAYTHFTSPIRRYPDLLVHRLLKRYLPQDSGRGGPKPARGLQKFLDTACAQSSEREKLAVAAEREYTKIKSLEFLSRRIGNSYEGVISGVTSFGIFVELSRYLIEGLVPLKGLKDDFYKYDQENFRCVGEKSGKVYQLGGRVTARIKSVSVEERRAEFEIL